MNKQELKKAWDFIIDLLKKLEACADDKGGEWDFFYDMYLSFAAKVDYLTQVYLQRL